MSGAGAQASVNVSGAGTHATREVTWHPRVGLFLLLILLGLLLTMIGTYALGRFGAAAALALVLAGPPSAVALALGLRQAIPKFRRLCKSLTWWHGLWLVLLVSGFVFRTRAIADIEQNPLDTAAVFRVVLVGITALVLMVRLALRRPPWLGSFCRGLVGVMALFGLVCAVSATWSVKPSWTLYKSWEYLIDVALLAAILASVRSLGTYETLLDWTWVLCGLLVASAWLEAPFWPEEAWEGQYVGGLLNIRLGGIFPGQGSNAVGTLGAIVAAIAVCRLLPAVQRKFDRAWYILLLAFGVATMVFTQTRSAIGGFVLGVLLVFFFHQAGTSGRGPRVCVGGGPGLDRCGQRSARFPAARSERGGNRDTFRPRRVVGGCLGGLQAASMDRPRRLRRRILCRMAEPGTQGSWTTPQRLC